MSLLTSAPEDLGTVMLRVDPGSSLAEVFLVDHHLRLVARSVGPLTEQVVPGVYKIKIQEGRASRERTILLVRDENLQFKPLQIDSSAPLLGASRTHEYHIGGAADRSRLIDFTKGQGGRLFVMIRHWSEDSGRVAPPSEHPAAGLALAAWDGSWRLDLADLPVEDPQRDAWCAVNVEVDPGTYLFQSAVDGGALLEQAVVVSADWQTQVFLLTRPRLGLSVSEESAAGRLTRLAEVLNVTVLMSRNGFSPGDWQLHRTEIARLALADDRPVRSRELDELLRFKVNNPMLGIMGAHLLLLAREEMQQVEENARRRERLRMESRGTKRRPHEAFDQELFDTVIRNLHALVGYEHPDVRALALQSSQTDPHTPVATAPMLHSSWSLLVSGSDIWPELVPLELWRRVAMRAATTPFLGWLRYPENDTAEAEFLNDLRSHVAAPSRTIAEAPARAMRPGAKSAPHHVEPRERARVELQQMDIPRAAAEWLVGE